MYALLDRCITEQFAAGLDGAEPLPAPPKLPFLSQQSGNGGGKTTNGNGGKGVDNGRAEGTIAFAGGGGP